MSENPSELSRYFSIEIDQLRTDHPCPFELFLYFEKSKHLIHWKKIGFLPDLKWVKDQTERGITQVWVSSKDEPLFKNYLARKPMDKDKSLPPTQDHHSQLLDAFETSDLPLEPKTQRLALETAQLLSKIKDATDLDEELKSRAHLFENIRTLILPPILNTLPEVRPLLELSDLSPASTHGYRVAAYSVAFALANGRTQLSLLVDLALAGLFHDIGLSLTPLSITRQPIQELNSTHRNEYERHVEHTLKLLEQFGGPLPNRSKVFILQHHEKMDGTGYPRKKGASDLDKNVQYLAMADCIDSTCSGLIDGKQIRFKNALEFTLRQFNKITLPDLYEPVKTWLEGGSLV